MNAIEAKPFTKQAPSPAGEGWGEENFNKENTFKFPLILAFALQGWSKCGKG
jgi:hypothetical protein